MARKQLGSAPSSAADVVTKGYLASAIANLGGGGGAPVRPSIFHIDDFGADPTGETPSDEALVAARTELGSGPGFIEFGIGTYVINTAGLSVENNMSLGLRQGVFGQNSCATTVIYKGLHALFEFRNLDWEFNTASEGPGGIHGMWLYGWENNNTNVYAIRYGDLGRMTVKDVHIAGFNKAGNVGIYGDNQVAWSERANIEASVEQCTTAFLFEGCMPNATQSIGTSFDYSKYRLAFVAAPNQDAFVLRAKPGGMNTHMNGVDLALTGNCILAAPGQTNSGALFRMGRDNADGSAFSGELHINVETSGDLGSGEAHHDFIQGTDPYWEVQSKVVAFGTINLIPFSGADFQVGTAHPRNFAFAGLLKRSPTFGSTTNSQAFQSLQLVSQARGEYWKAPSNAVHMVYVEQATAGAFTLSYNSVATAPIPYSPSVAQVQAALDGIPALAGNVTVTQAQARFVNGFYADEVGFGVTYNNGLAETATHVLVADDSSLTGSVAVVVRNDGSSNKTLTARIETGNIVKIEETAGVYRLGLDIGSLTESSGVDRDSPFGVFGVDIWLKQPSTGGNVVLEGPHFASSALAGSTYSFQWFDGIEPVLTTEHDAFDLIRISSFNFNSWIGQHITRQLVIDVPATPTSPGVKGQRAADSTYEYTCIAADTWKRVPFDSTW